MLMAALTRNKGSEQVCKANNFLQSLHMSMQQLCTVVAYGYATAIIERFNRTLKTKMYKYFTKNYTNRYLDVIGKLLKRYNNSIRSTIDMTPRKVNPSNIYSIWQTMNSLRCKIPPWRVKFKVGDLVLRTREKQKFAKGTYKRFLHKHLRLSRSFSGCPNLFMSCKTCRLGISKASFRITNLSRYHPKPRSK